MHDLVKRYALAPWRAPARQFPSETHGSSHLEELEQQADPLTKVDCFEANGHQNRCLEVG